ncbi:MAG TPA: AsmA-like C-terminal region-containing protein [Vicinamibacterales bacterium]|nr:AsmA-like C-terminal region-containing protein [Vicinamibacterales bacterium]
MRRLVIALIVVAGLIAAVYGAATYVLGSGVVRSSIERQLADRLGEPVHIASAGASIFPRVALNLRGVTIGEPAAITLGSVRVVTGLRGLLSRTIENAEVVVSDSRITLPLPMPMLSGLSAPSSAPASGFSITSIRVISLRDVEVDVGRQTWRVDADSSLEGDRLQVKRLTLRGARTRMSASGQLTSVARSEGQFDVHADPLDVDEVIAMAASAKASAGSANASAARASAGRPTLMHIVVNATAPRGTFGAYAFRDLAATTTLQSGSTQVSPLTVSMYGGRFQGRLDADTAGAVPRLTLSGRLDGVDVAQVMKAASLGDAMTGRLGARLSLKAAGSEASALMRSAGGTIEASVVDGRIPHLDLVRTLVLAFGKPSGAPPAGSGSAFSRLAGTLALAGGTLTFDALTLDSRDVDLQGRGTLRLAGGRLDAHADVLLSRALTAQAGTDLRRYAQQDGRVILPVVVGGTLEHPVVTVDLAAAGRRALENELKRKARSLLDRLIGKKGPGVQ